MPAGATPVLVVPASVPASLSSPNPHAHSAVCDTHAADQKDADAHAANETNANAAELDTDADAA